ncbi:uncharacterized protein [Centruroides vittatus]|uniref:uncharacterized protein n=1 Tax=Centruroides vittatus TaxID=120091 RepID=UPI00350F7D89
MKFLLFLITTATLLKDIAPQSYGSEEFCYDSSKALNFWDCALDTLPHYYKNLYLDLADCVITETGISTKKIALVYYFCADQSLLQNIAKCFGEKRLIYNDRQDEEINEDIVVDTFTNCFTKNYLNK